jgi:hypothetical protein
MLWNSAWQRITHKTWDNCFFWHLCQNFNLRDFFYRIRHLCDHLRAAMSRLHVLAAVRDCLSSKAIHTGSRYPPSLLFKRYCCSFPGVQEPGSEDDPSPPFSTEVYSPCLPSWYKGQIHRYFFLLKFHHVKQCLGYKGCGRWTLAIDWFLVPPLLT